MNNEEVKLEKETDKTIDKTALPEEKIVLQYPICNERLMYMEPDGNTLHCKKCEKFFKNDNKSIGEETSNPFTDNDLIY